MRVFFASVLLFWSASFWACGSDDDHGAVGPNSALVGGRCDGNKDCQERCVTGGDYPGGMCTVSCNDDRDCPSGSACVDASGGVCAPLCGGKGDCDPFGPGWACRDRKLKHGPGQVTVCRGD